jgi:hypothetical protein
MFRQNRPIRLIYLGVVLTASFLFAPFPANGQQDAQCEVLKERITKPQNDEQRDKRSYYCDEMRRRNCAEVESLCASAPKSESLDDFAGTWENQVTGDSKFKERWVITITGGSVSVEGFYLDKQTGEEKGKFNKAEITHEKGRGLGFAQVFNPKPDPGWADSNSIRDLAVNGDTLTFKHEYGEHVLYRKRE